MTFGDLNIDLNEKNDQNTFDCTYLVQLNASFRSFLSLIVFELSRVVILTPPPTRAKVAETATRARVNKPDIYLHHLLKNVDSVVRCDSWKAKTKTLISRSIGTHTGELGHATIVLLTMPMFGESTSTIILKCQRRDMRYRFHF